MAASIFGFHTGNLAKADVLVPAPLAEQARAVLDAALEAAAEDDVDSAPGIDPVAPESPTPKP